MEDAYSETDQAADVHAVAMVLSVLLAGAEMQNKGLLARMHHSLTALLIDAVSAAPAAASNAPPGTERRFEARALAMLDRIFTNARALK